MPLVRFGPVYFDGPGRYGLGELLSGSFPVAGPIVDYFGSTRALTYPDGRVVDRPEPHNGLDIEARQGTKVRAPADGLVIRTGVANGAGFYVVLRHSERYQTHYYHLKELSPVEVGTRVKRGDVIGRVGSTGFSSGPHLHLGVFDSERGYVDPLAFLDFVLEGDALPPELTATCDRHVSAVLDALTGTDGAQIVPERADDETFVYALRIPRRRLEERR